MLEIISSIVEAISTFFTSAIDLVAGSITGA